MGRCGGPLRDRGASWIAQPQHDPSLRSSKKASKRQKDFAESAQISVSYKGAPVNNIVCTLSCHGYLFRDVDI